MWVDDSGSMRRATLSLCMKPFQQSLIIPVFAVLIGLAVLGYFVGWIALIALAPD